MKQALRLKNSFKEVNICNNGNQNDVSTAIYCILYNLHPDNHIAGSKGKICMTHASVTVCAILRNRVGQTYNFIFK